MAGFPLQPALDIAERRAEAKSRIVKLAYVRWLNARTRLVRLEQRRKQYSGDLSAKLRQGCSASMARRAGESLHQWQTDMEAARLAFEAARQEWQMALDAWMVQRKRVEALSLLARRHALEEARQEEKRERRLHDELSARGAYVRRIGAQEDTDLPLLMQGAHR